MNSKIIGMLMFVAGATVGAAATSQYFKKKYEAIAQEEINSVKEIFNKNTSKTITEEIEVESDDDVVTEIDEYEDIVEDNGYICPDDLANNSPRNHLVAPYVISPDEFGELDGYDQISLTCYADMTLTDENDCLIEDVEGCVGFDSLSHFGEYEDDSVFVRNERLKTDFEILLDQRTYSDILNKKPYLKED